MSFHGSATGIRLDDGHILRATLTNGGGEQVEAELDLNSFIGNNNGQFEWGGADFSLSAEDIAFGVEGDDNVPVLRARLRTVEGEYQEADINLAERIGNNDGSFEFV